MNFGTVLSSETKTDLISKPTSLPWSYITMACKLKLENNFVYLISII